MAAVSIFLNSQGLTASPEEEGFIRVYAHDSAANCWELIKEFEFSLAKSKSISEMRGVILNMIQRTGDCRVFAAREVAGQLYSVLEANRFSIYEAEGRPEQFLESILASEAEADKSAAEKKPREIPACPEKTGVEGTYFINLKAALNSDPALTSKKILMPFLADGNFKALEVICEHVPRWFGDEFQKRGLLSEVNKLDENEYKVVISVK